MSDHGNENDNGNDDDNMNVNDDDPPESPNSALEAAAAIPEPPPPSPSEILRSQIQTSLFEASVSAQWDTVVTLCDDYAAADAACGDNALPVTDDDYAALLSTIDAYTDEPRQNPLLAAVLHVAMDMAACQKSVSLFAEAAAQETVDVEERRRLESIPVSFEGSITVADFCPYLQMRHDNNNNNNNTGSNTGVMVNDNERRQRRKAIAKLCRTNPIWILLPMNPLGKLYDEDAMEGDPPRGTTALHVAVRSRNVTLVQLLMKYCRKAAEISDGDGCLPLHYAVRPPDEFGVLRRALTNMGSAANENNWTDPMGAMSFGLNLQYRAKSYFKAIHDTTTLARYRVRRLKRKLKLREICKHSKKYANKRAATTTASTATNTASAAAVAGCSNTIASPKPESGVQTRSKTGSTPSSSSSATKKEENIQQCVKCNDASSDNLGSSKNGDTNAAAADNDDDSSSDREPKSDAYMKVDIQPHPNMYDSPSNLIRAMMYLGTIEEDAPDLIECEWNVNEVEESKNVAQEYPLLLDKERHVSNGVIRANRPWKTEQNRVDVIRLLATAYRAGMASQSDEGGETPLILCCRTLKGGNDDDELDDDMEEDDMEDGLGDRPNNGQEDAVDETGEDVADYEMDLPSFEPVGVESESPPVDEVFGDIMPQPEQNNVEGVVEGQGNNEGAPAEPAEQNVNEGVAANNNEGANNPNQPPVDPLQAIFIMIAIDKTNRHDALGTPDDEGDTPLHTATRIGAPSRLVRHILNALPSSASTPAEDGATPLHLVCRRASHLAPEGPAGLATYDSDTIRLFADAAGAGTLVAADDEGRTPLHVACYHGASPAALAELADADGGNESLLVRDMEGHAPLGVYCKHATDFHGLRVLVEACPEAAAAVGDGKQLPLHRVVGAFNLTVNVDVLKLLGTAYPRGLSAKDSNGMSPLALLCNSYRSPLSIDLPKLKDGRTTLGRCLSNKIWLMVKYLVLAGRVNTEWNRSHMITEAGNLDEDGNVVSVPPPERMLHAALREPASSIEIIMLTLVIHQDQLPLADEDGNTPLHICCHRDSGCTEKGEDASDDLPADDDSVYERVNKECVIDNLPNGCEVDISNRGETSPRRRYNPYADFNPILFYILSHDRSAAERRNKDGKYPLNILIDKGSTWIGGGVERVFKACPAALFSYEMNNSIFVRTLTRAASFRTSNPFKLKEEQAKSIGALFQLLRGKPTVLEGAFKGKVVARRNPRRSASTQSSTAGVETKKKRARTRKK